VRPKNPDKRGIFRAEGKRPMSARLHIPRYRKHKASGQAIVTLSDAVTGRRKDYLLGRYGSAKSKAEYRRVLVEWESQGRHLPGAYHDLTMNELILAYWQHCQGYYRRPDGEPTSELACLKQALRPLKELYGPTPAADFGPLRLEAVRQRMVDLGWCRRTINLHVGRIKHFWKWAVAKEKVPPSVYQGVRAVEGLRCGRSEARETAPVLPVPEAHINATRPFIAREVEAMIDLQLLTGMRPGEVCIMRPCDLEITGRIWVYRPAHHKTMHHDKGRQVYLGPKAQEIVKPFLTVDLQAYLFSPWQAREERFEKIRRERKTKVQPSQVCRRKRNAKRLPRDHYDVNSYRRAITYGCDRAFALPTHLAPRQKQDGRREPRTAWWGRLTPAEKEEVRTWRRKCRWHPHQLRHNAATNLRREFGVELARIILGHAAAFTTEVYAEADRQQAMEVIAKIG
jgi:integrase